MKPALNITKYVKADKVCSFPIPVRIRLNIFLSAMIIFLFLFQRESVIAGPVTPTDSVRTAESITEPRVYPSSFWLAAQIIPSPQLITLKNDSPRFGLRWQVTPLLYSFGINRRLSPWRTFVVEPLTRQNGSVELYFSPDYLNITDHFKSNWLFRGGLRAYFPIYRRGEYLSASLSTSYYNMNGNQGISYEAGVYLFFGILGFQVTYSPEMKSSPLIFTLRLRYF